MKGAGGRRAATLLLLLCGRGGRSVDAFASPRPLPSAATAPTGGRRRPSSRPPAAAAAPLRLRPPRRSARRRPHPPSLASSESPTPPPPTPPPPREGATTPDSLPPDLDRALSSHHTPFTRAAAVYGSYLRRLWTETDPDHRRRNAREEVAGAIRRVESLLVRSDGGTHGFWTDCYDREGDEECGIREERAEEARERMLDACERMLEVLDEEEKAEAAPSSAEASGPAPAEPVPTASSAAAAEAKRAASEELVVAAPSESASAAAPAKKKKKKPRRSILFGAAMGAVVACWVFSGNYIFTGLFTLMTILGQLEYYRMCMGTGVYPARRISVVGACSMFVTALFAPELHQICLPVFGMASMVWFLTMRRQVSTIPEIATTFTGMFYLGYVPSFWVRTRLIGGGLEPTRLAPLLSPVLESLGRKASTSLPAWMPRAVHLPVTAGAVFIFWTWLCIAFSDVGAYFVGRSFGRTKLGRVAPAAGATSPNKTVEGLLGGCAVSAALAALGGWVQRWPYWYVTGPLHGLYLGVLGLVGDLTASMLKRDAGIKDFGDLIPEHGGIMDRVDSFIFTAPYSWLVCAYIIPWLKGVARARAAVPLV